ncbi:MAG: molybdopterin-guanine dinucleotide biosynthesis protein B [Hyphomicrobiaceae bacterium]|nr:molybdopterin-guanine dinucleotide biosynthesis protein B [Hyphomicrobiaceae bacterium]
MTCEADGLPAVGAHEAAAKPLVIGIAGWKNSGKTTLAERLIAELTRRGLRVASIKHAHHAFEIDGGATDSARHRTAGAQQVAIVSGARWALVRELKGAPEPRLEEILAKLDPADVVVVEGYKRAPITKIEVRRAAALGKEPLADSDPLVAAIAADTPVEGARVPVFRLDDIAGIADLVLSRAVR